MGFRLVDAGAPTKAFGRKEVKNRERYGRVVLSLLGIRQPAILGPFV